jgi:hypothetical protein
VLVREWGQAAEGLQAAVTSGWLQGLAMRCSAGAGVRRFAGWRERRERVRRVDAHACRGWDGQW